MNYFKNIFIVSVLFFNVFCGAILESQCIFCKKADEKLKYLKVSNKAFSDFPMHFDCLHSEYRQRKKAFKNSQKRLGCTYCSIYCSCTEDITLTEYIKYHEPFTCNIDLNNCLLAFFGLTFNRGLKISFVSEKQLLCKKNEDPDLKKKIQFLVDVLKELKLDETEQEEDETEQKELQESVIELRSVDGSFKMPKSFF